MPIEGDYCPKCGEPRFTFRLRGNTGYYDLYHDQCEGNCYSCHLQELRERTPKQTKITDFMEAIA